MIGGAGFGTVCVSLPTRMKSSRPPRHQPTPHTRGTLRMGRNWPVKPTIRDLGPCVFHPFACNQDRHVSQLEAAEYRVQL